MRLVVDSFGVIGTSTVPGIKFLALENLSGMAVGQHDRGCYEIFLQA